MINFIQVEKKQICNSFVFKLKQLIEKQKSILKIFVTLVRTSKKTQQLFTIMGVKKDESSKTKQTKRQEKNRRKRGNEGGYFFVIEKVNEHIFKEIHLLKNVNGA